jgi:predicted metal-dependent phosphoesterase TrpH
MAVIVDLHVHTVRGSSDSALSLDEMIDRALDVGLGAVVITEHNHLWNDPHWDDQVRERGLVALHGIEVSTDCGHILALGLHGYVSGIHKAAVLREVADQFGGILISAHPFRRAFDPGPHIQNLLHLQFPTVEDAAAHPIFELVDGIEVLNSGTGDHENEFAIEVARHLGIPMLGGSDSHSANSIGHRATQIDGQVRSMRDLVNAIRDGACRPVSGLLQGEILTIS